MAGHVPQINCLQLYQLYTITTLLPTCWNMPLRYVLWQLAICKRYILHLCQWRNVYGVSFPVRRWMSASLMSSCHGRVNSPHQKNMKDVDVSLILYPSLPLFQTVSCRSPLQHPSPFSTLVWASSLLRFLLSVLPGGKGDLDFEQKTRGRKLCRNIWRVFSPLLCSEKCHPHPRNSFKRGRK